jgi:hypothetical protein
VKGGRTCSGMVWANETQSRPVLSAPALAPPTCDLRSFTSTPPTAALLTSSPFHHHHLINARKFLMHNIKIRSNVRKSRGGCDILSSPRVSGIRREWAREAGHSRGPGSGFEITRVRREEEGTLQGCVVPRRSAGEWSQCLARGMRCDNREATLCIRVM